MRVGSKPPLDSEPFCLKNVKARLDSPKEK